MPSINEPFDIAIVGAGAAGIAAARRLSGSGLDTVLLEASSRIGGRAWTLEAAGMVLDMGCGWLHTADRNPWVAIAEAAGFEIDRRNPPWGRTVPRPCFSIPDQKDANEAYGRWHARILDMPLPSDVAAGHLTPGCRWNPYLQAMSGFMNGDVLENISIADYANYERASTEENWRPRRGYGTLIAASMPVDTPCLLATPIERLALHGRRGIVLSTPRGDIAAKVAILTVSTAVLSGETIRFPDALDPWREAARQLPLGHDEKLFLQIVDDGAFPAEMHAIGNPHDAATAAYHVRPLGQPVIECFLGGASAQLLAEAGQAVAAEHVARELVALFGERARRGARVLAGTHWHHDTRIGGAYSHAMPRHASARQALAMPFANCVYFAGEATHESAFSTAHGAYLSGVRAAEEVLAAHGGG